MMMLNLSGSKFKFLVCLCALMLTACASEPLPDYRYYKSMQSSAPKRFAQSVIASSLEIEPLRADGVFGERPIVYSFADEPQKLSQYHYQLWTDPPGAWIQRRMIDRLAQMNVAEQVTARANVRERPAKLVGVVEELQRVKQDDGRWQVIVSLRIRVDLSAGRQRLLEKSYRQSAMVTGETMAESVEVFGAVVDQITDALSIDMQTATAAKSN
jgi:uncharacterized lipoprotein YmbA